jgi:hypothetical protein
VVLLPSVRSAVRVGVARQAEAASEAVRLEKRFNQLEERQDAFLMTHPRRRRHDQLAVDELVSHPVGREGEHLRAGPVGQFGHAHIVRSAG